MTRGICDNLVGKRFGKLFVLGKEKSDFHGNSIWKCICDCGTIKNIHG